MYKDNNECALDYIIREVDNVPILGGIFKLTNDNEDTSTLVLYKEDDSLLITMSKSINLLNEKYKVLSLSTDIDLDIIVASVQIKDGKLIMSKVKGIDEFLDDKFAGYSIIEAIQNLDRDDMSILRYKMIDYLSNL